MSWVWHKQRKKASRPDWDQKVTAPQSGLLEHVYAWERRCRGYDIAPYPVALEPPFVAFDSGSSAFLPTRDPDPQPGELSFLPLLLPAAQKVAAPTASGWLQSIRCHGPVAFEILADSREIAYQMACGRSESAEIMASLPTYFPLAHHDARARQDEPDRLGSHLNTLRGQTVGYKVIDFGLQEFAYRPLRRFQAYLPDPLAPVVAALAALEQEEVAGLQVLFTRTQRPWAQSLEQLAKLFTEETSFGSAARAHGVQEQEVLVRDKLASPLYAAVLRVFAVSPAGDARAFDLCRRIGGALSGFTEPGINALIPLDDRSGGYGNGGYDDAGYATEYPVEDHLRDLLARRSRRCGFLLSADELVGLVHPPAESLLHPKLARPNGRERVLPQHLLEMPGATLGGYAHRGRAQPVVWPDEFRNRHMYLLGATRMGKSTLLLNLIVQDLREGRGLCLIDPHGDLAQDVLGLVTPQRADDVLYLNFGDEEFPPAIGLFDAGDEWEQRLLCSDLLSILRRLFAGSWGDRLEHILRHVLLTLLAEPGHTLRDIRPLLSDKDYRATVLPSITDPELKSFWSGEFGSYTPATFAPLYNKLGLLLSSPLLRNIVAQSESRLNVRRIMAEKKVLIVNLNSALVGEDNAHFLGALLVSKIQIAAMQGLRRGRAERVPFTLYVDEFQNFVVSSFEKILSEAGKAGLSLVMANQFLEQLNGSLQSAILGNVGTLASFRVSADSGRLLEKELAGRFRAEEIVSLQRGQAIVRIGDAQGSAQIETVPPPQRAVTDRVENEVLVEGIIGRTHDSCCRPRAEVESEFAAEGNQSQGKATGSEDSGKRQSPEEKKKQNATVPPNTTEAPVGDRANQQATQQSAASEEQGQGNAQEPEFFGMPDEPL